VPERPAPPPSPRAPVGSQRPDVGGVPPQPGIPRPPVRGGRPEPTPPQRGPVTAPVAGTRFTVSIDGRDIAVARVSSPQLLVDRESLQLESLGDRLPSVWSGAPATGAVVLERAFDGDTTFYAWRRRAATHDVKAQHAATLDVQITVLDAAGTEVGALLLQRAWPVRWSGPALDANEPHVALESLELVYADLLMR
jgi:phage tail-like protein